MEDGKKANLAAVFKLGQLSDRINGIDSSTEQTSTMLTKLGSRTGNSEVGHLNIGAGRVVWQDIGRIDVSIKKCQFHNNETILESLKRVKAGNGRLHLLGLISDGGVHSHIIHLYALLEAAKEQGVPTPGARADKRLEGIRRTKVGGSK